jgi:dihydrofolate reductase
MRKLIVSMMVSLDGMIARADGDLSWFRSDEQFEAKMLDLLRSVDAMLFGRVSYELLAEYWPTAGDIAAGGAPGGFTTRERQIEFARLMNGIHKVVFSRTLTQAHWGPATIVSDAAPAIASMKAQAGKDLVLFAGADLASSLVSLDVVDEMRLMVHPIVLGTGIPLFGAVSVERPLELREALTLPCGVVLLRYDRARGV